jgi:predicted alpha/beta superfamily hydrolase
MTRSFPPVTLPNTEVRYLQATHVAQEYKLFVQLPNDYATSVDTYPALYVSDANWIFPTVSQIASRLHLDTNIRTPIVIGIGYPTDDFNTQLGLRVRDFTPTRNPARDTRRQKELGVPYTTGYANNFLRFIREELFSFVEAEYHIAPVNRTFIGYSYGGLFGLHVLFTQPDTFQRYVLCSPSFGWDNQMIFDTERSCAEHRSELPARLYMSMGGLEEQLYDPTTSSLNRMTDLLKSRDYAGLAVTQAVFENEPHSTIVSASVAQGLRWVNTLPGNATVGEPD